MKRLSANSADADTADGIESTTDIVSSLVVWTGLKICARPVDDDHSFDYGKAEPIAVVVALAQLAAVVFIAVQSLLRIIMSHLAPAWFTLFVLALVTGTKEKLYRFVFKAGDELTSTTALTPAPRWPPSWASPSP